MRKMNRPAIMHLILTLLNYLLGGRKDGMGGHRVPDPRSMHTPIFLFLTDDRLTKAGWSGHKTQNFRAHQKNDYIPLAISWWAG